MYQDSLNQVRKNYAFYCNLRKQILIYQDRFIELENMSIIIKYNELLDEIEFYNDEAYFKSLVKYKEELEEETKVLEYIQNGNKEYIQRYPEVEDYVTTCNMLDVGRKNKLHELNKQKTFLEEDNFVKEYLKIKDFISKYDSSYIDTQMMQTKAFETVDDPDFTYLLIDDGTYTFYNLETGKSIIINKNDRKKITDFYRSHCVISNPNINTILGINEISYSYQKRFLLDKFKDADICTKEARQFIKEYPQKTH